MTDNEVIHELNKIKSYAGSTNDIDKRDRAIEAAKKAVGKQIPQKVVFGDGVTIPPHSSGNCPVCNAEMIRDRLAREKRHISYCYLCGQCLDWSDKE